MTQLIFSTISFFLATTLNPTMTATDTDVHDFKFPYQMEAPIKTFEMAGGLDEISGLSLTEDEQFLLANNDEMGRIFMLNKETGVIEKAIDFYKEGDYEGIEMIGNRVFVVKSTGTIYEVEDINAPELNIINHNFFLSKENDVEALGYDAKNNRLLLGCKGKSGEGEAFMRKKAVFAFDLNTMILQEEPVFMITLEDVCTYLGQCSLQDHVLDNLNEFFNPKGEVLGFSPSSLAVHPITGHIYITSSKGKMILVLDPAGKILHIEKLKKPIHPQPEGLCFEKDGTMWISNEAKKAAPARIYKFAYNG
jgi:uncharacterized protein YjiK